MTEKRVQRRLAAILAVDVVGYSRLMERDEAGTLATPKSRRSEILQPVISKHHGRIVKLMGDGVLVEFGSAVNAVDCAVELQTAMDIANTGVVGDRRIVLRAGINLGDVMVYGIDLYGDGVNIAARLEGLSEPGGLCISGSVFEHVNGKLSHSFVSLGPQTLKNIGRPIQIYRLAGKDEPGAAVSAVELPLPDKPSIVVLPFANMSADAEQENFVDGLTEDLITDLSKVPALFVIARNSSFAYMGRSVDTRQIARELGVKYVLEGSARRAQTLLLSKPTFQDQPLDRIPALSRHGDARQDCRRPSQGRAAGVTAIAHISLSCNCVIPRRGGIHDVHCLRSRCRCTRSFFG